MDVVVPKNGLFDLIEQHHTTTSSKGGRPSYPLETMLRIHLLLQWYDLRNPAMEDALIETARAHFRGKVENPNRVVKLQLGFLKTLLR